MLTELSFLRKGKRMKIEERSPIAGQFHTTRTWQM